MRFKLTALFIVLWIFIVGITFGEEPRPMGLIFGKSTVKDVISTFKKRGAEEVFKDKAYIVILDTKQGMMAVLSPKLIVDQANVRQNSLVELPNLSSVIAYNIPDLGKDSFVFAFFEKGKLFYMKYIVSMNQDSRDVIRKIVSTLQKKYKFKSLGDAEKEISKLIEKGVQNSLGVDRFGLSGTAVATHGNVMIMMGIVNEGNKNAFMIEYANNPIFEKLTNRAKSIYKKNNSFESLF